jgi:hypothetical protein
MQIGFALLCNVKKTYIRRQTMGQPVAIGAISWVARPSKLLADIPLLLALIMFLENVKGALCLLPALENFLLKTLALQRCAAGIVQLAGETA